MNWRAFPAVAAPLALGVALLTTLSVTGAAYASSGSVQATGTAAATLGQCVQQTGKLIVVVMMDESASLKGYPGQPATDPTNERVAGLGAALTGLATLASTPINGRRPSVQVLLTGFSTALVPRPGSAAFRWEPVTESDLGHLLHQAAGYASKNTGQDTDYGTALVGIRRLLAEKSAAMTTGGGASPCKALVWFTDGQYSIEPRVWPGASAYPKRLSYLPGVNLATTPARKLATETLNADRQLLCKPDGVMDQLNQDGVVRFTFGLSSERDGVNNMPAWASDFLDAATTGAGGTTRCGSNLSTATGDYTLAHPSTLFFDFANLLGSSSAPIRYRPVCSAAACRAGTGRFDALTGMSGFELQVGTPVAGTVVQLRAPNGDSAQIRYGGATHPTLAGTALAATWVSPEDLELSGRFGAPTAGWPGHWRYTFVKTSGRAGGLAAGFRAQLYSGLIPTLSGRQTVLRGAPTAMQIELLDPAGSSGRQLARKARVQADLSVRAGLAPQSLTVTRSTGSLFTTGVSLPESATASAVALQLVSTFPSEGATPIIGQSRTYQLRTVLPVKQGFPTVRPPVLQLRSVTGRGGTSGTIRITGNPYAVGCVWIGAPTIQAPDGSGSVRFTVGPDADRAGSCVSVSKSGHSSITVRFRSLRSTLGTVTATLPVYLKSSTTHGSRTTTIQASFELQPSPNVAKRVGIIVLLTLFGILLPLLILWLINYFTGSLASAKYIMAATFEVFVKDGELATGDGEIDVRAPGALTRVAPDASERGRREMSAGPFLIRAKTVRRFSDLFRGPFAVATSHSQLMVGPKDAERDIALAEQARVPLSVAGTWLYEPKTFTGADSTMASGTLTVLIASGGANRAGRAQALIDQAALTITQADWTATDSERTTLQPLGHSLRALFGRKATKTERPVAPADDFDDDFSESRRDGGTHTESTRAGDGFSQDDDPY